MKITGKYSIAFFLKLGINFILLINILVLLTLPLLLNFLYESPELQSSRNFYEAGEEDLSPASSPGDLLYGNSRWIFFNEIPDESYGFMLGFLYFSGIGTAMILFLIRKVLKSLEKDVILDYSNAKAFKLLSLSCSVLVVAFVVKIIFYNTFLTLFCFFLFIILGLFTLVLSEVFRQGAIIKEENELTI